MRTNIRAWCLIFICVFSLSSCTKDRIFPQENPGLNTEDLADTYPYSQIETAILTAVNEYRKSKGFIALKKGDEITLQAKIHTLYMVENKDINHDNFNERSTLLVEAIGARAVGENVASGYTTAHAVVQGWIGSPGHLANIEGDFTHFGVSVEQDENEKNYFTNIFVKR